MTEDPKISQRYRELSREEPSREIDAAILAAARRAAETRPAPLVVPTGRRRWYFPVAAAAIIILAVAVTMHVERQQPDPEMAVPPVLSPPPEAPAAKAPTETEKPKPPTKPRSAPKAAAPPIFVPDPRPEPPQHSRQADTASTARREETAPSAGAPAARLSVQMRAQRDAAEETPERMLERIAELRRQGRHEEADKALAEFRRRYPDYRIPEAMREKVEKK